MLKKTFIASSLLLCSIANAALINIFPIDASKQIVSSYIDPAASDYNTPLLTAAQQQARLETFYRRYFSSMGSDQSPWNSTFVNHFIASNPFKTFENQVLTSLALSSKYRTSFQKWTSTQIASVQNEMNMSQAIASYSDANRAIAVTNIQSRVIPTIQPNFKKYTTPGEGYPFDYTLQTTIYAGTPLYVIAKSTSGKWLYVLTPRISTWVPASSIAMADASFVTKWQSAAKVKLAAIMQNDTPLTTADGYTLFANVGSVFPVSQDSAAIHRVNASDDLLMIPERDSNGNAYVGNVNFDNYLASTQVAIMPLAATPHNFSNLIQALQNKDYGWCGYNLGTDGALEIQDLMTPFGFFLPRYITDEMNVGNVVTLSSSYTPSQVQQYLMTNAHSLVSFVTYGSQISLYVGSSDAYGTAAPIVYQNMWGLRDSGNTYRTVVGQSVLFPLLPNYSVIDPSLSQLKSPLSFTVKMSLLDQNSSMNKNSKINFDHYIFPEWMVENGGSTLDAANK